MKDEVGTFAIEIRSPRELGQLRSIFEKIMDANAGKGDVDLLANQKLSIDRSDMTWVKSGGNITQIQVVTNQEIGILAKKGIEFLDEINRKNPADVLVDDDVLVWNWREIKKIIIKAILKHWLETGLNQTEIAEHLDIQRSYLSRLISEYGFGKH